MGLTTLKAFTLFLCLLCCFICPGGAFVFEENGTVRPNNPVVFIGNNLNLFCNLTALHIRTNSSSMYFTKTFRNGTHKITRSIPQKYIKIINTRTIKLEFPVKSSANQGTYYCKINRTMDMAPLTLGRQYVMVEYEPKPVESIDCRVFNWKTMRCTWELGVNYINMDNIIVTMVWAIQSQEDCPHPTKTSCTWDDDDDDVGKSFKPDFPYIMMINTTLVNQVGKLHMEVKSKYFRIDSRLIVEPARVDKLTVSSQTSTCATLHWQHNQVVYDKVYRLRYRPQWDEDAEWMELGQIKAEQVTVCGLKPATNYTFRVSCLPIPTGDVNPAGFWSGWRTVVNQTAEDIPGRAPKLSTGGYTEEPCSDFVGCRDVTIFWQPVDEHHQHGRILGYEVNFSETQGGENKTFIIKSESNTSTTLRLLSDKDYTVRLRARNSMGYSPTHSSLTIPSIAKTPAAPSHFLVESSSHSDQQRFYLSWSAPHVDHKTDYEYYLPQLGYTLFWCHGSHQRLICENHIDWVSLPVNQTSFEYLSSGDCVKHDRLFGISRELTSKDGNPVSSGIMWSTCSYVKGRKPDKSPKNIRLSDNQEDLSLKIEWQLFDCFESRGYVTHYLIHYCKADVSGLCLGPVFNVTVVNTQTHYVLHDLDPDESYKITAQAVSSAGTGPESKPIRGKVVDNDLARNTGAIVGFAIGGVFVLLMMAFIVILIIKKCLRVKKNFYYHAKYPDSINSLPPLPQGYPLNDPKYHFQDRPLPPRPDAAPFSLGILDDGYSSAGSNPSNEVKYEPIGTKPVDNNRESRNISITSETCLLGYMEDNSKSDDKYNHKGKISKTQNGDDGAPKMSTCNSFGVKHPLGLLDNAVNCDSKVKKVSNIAEDTAPDASADSYTKFGLEAQSDSSTNSSPIQRENCKPGESFEKLCEPSITHLQQIQNINYVPPQSPALGFVFSSPPPETPPPPPPIPCITRAERILAQIKEKQEGVDKRQSSTSYVSDVSSFMRPYRAECEGQNDAGEFADYCQVNGDALQTLPSHLEYVTHPDALSTSTSPSSSSTGPTSSSDSQMNSLSVCQATTRPLSDYMKQLPLHYFQDPQFNDDESPTTEL